MKTAVQMLKETNWLYIDIDNRYVDKAGRKVIGVMRNASSTMPEKATVDDIKGIQA